VLNQRAAEQHCGVESISRKCVQNRECPRCKQAASPTGVFGYAQWKLPQGKVRDQENWIAPARAPAPMRTTDRLRAKPEANAHTGEKACIDVSIRRWKPMKMSPAMSDTSGSAKAMRLLGGRMLSEETGRRPAQIHRMGSKRNAAAANYMPVSKAVRR